MSFDNSLWRAMVLDFPVSALAAFPFLLPLKLKPPAGSEYEAGTWKLPGVWGTSGEAENAAAAAWVVFRFFTGTGFTKASAVFLVLFFASARGVVGETKTGTGGSGVGWTSFGACLASVAFFFFLAAAFFFFAGCGAAIGTCSNPSNAVLIPSMCPFFLVANRVYWQ